LAVRRKASIERRVGGEACRKRAKAGLVGHTENVTWSKFAQFRLPIASRLRGYSARRVSKKTIKPHCLSSGVHDAATRRPKYNEVAIHSEPGHLLDLPLSPCAALSAASISLVNLGARSTSRGSKCGYRTLTVSSQQPLRTSLALT